MPEKNAQNHQTRPKKLPPGTPDTTFGPTTFGPATFGPGTSGCVFYYTGTSATLVELYELVSLLAINYPAPGGQFRVRLILGVNKTLASGDKVGQLISFNASTGALDTAFGTQGAALICSGGNPGVLGLNRAITLRLTPMGKPDRRFSLHNATRTYALVPTSQNITQAIFENDQMMLIGDTSSPLGAPSPSNRSTVLLKLRMQQDLFNDGLED